MTTIPAAAPSPYDEAMPFMQLLFGFRGRIPRQAFWLYGVVGLGLVSLMASLLLGIVGAAPRTADVASNLLIAWPAAAITVKRWHDRDKAGWWLMINLVPVVGVIWSLVENGLLRGTVGANRFGPEPTGRL